jgi:ABC-type branched-subunit amino acid transport system ATPase component
VAITNLNNMIILQIQNLTKVFDGIKALNNLSITIEENSITALVGPNGSGKTTLFNVISGFLQSDTGTILLNGRDIASLYPYQIVQRGLARTFQNIRLFPQISVLDNVLLGLKYETGDRFFAALLQTKSMKEEERVNIRKAEELLRFVGLLEKKDDLAENLSHGQRKLLELARILALDRNLLLLDEPTAGLFPAVKQQMFSHIKILKERGKTILFIEHDLNSVMDIAEKIIFLDHGQKIAKGTPQEIRENRAVQQIYMGKLKL